ncbi:MAG TPA: hypothetical protein PKV93_12960 [Fervidobacterium sp.]|nr:hypothetical protein [Fervidobacterium sp.]
MSKTITIEVYSIKELPEKVQQKVYYEWLNNVVYPWADDNRKTLEAFENIFPVNYPPPIEAGACRNASSVD